MSSRERQWSSWLCRPFQTDQGVISDFPHLPESLALDVELFKSSFFATWGYFLLQGQVTAVDGYAELVKTCRCFPQLSCFNYVAFWSRHRFCGKSIKTEDLLGVQVPKPQKWQNFHHVRFHIFCPQKAPKGWKNVKSNVITEPRPTNSGWITGSSKDAASEGPMEPCGDHRAKGDSKVCPKVSD